MDLPFDSSEEALNNWQQVFTKTQAQTPTTHAEITAQSQDLMSDFGGTEITKALSANEALLAPVLAAGKDPVSDTSILTTSLSTDRQSDITQKQPIDHVVSRPAESLFLAPVKSDIQPHTTALSSIDIVGMPYGDVQNPSFDLSVKRLTFSLPTENTSRGEPGLLVTESADLKATPIDPDIAMAEVRHVNFVMRDADPINLTLSQQRTIDVPAYVAARQIQPNQSEALSFNGQTIEAIRPQQMGVIDMSPTSAQPPSGDTSLQNAPVANTAPIEVDSSDIRQISPVIDVPFANDVTKASLALPNPNHTVADIPQANLPQTSLATEQSGITPKAGTAQHNDVSSKLVEIGISAETKVPPQQNSSIAIQSTPTHMSVQQTGLHLTPPAQAEPVSTGNPTGHTPNIETGAVSVTPAKSENFLWQPSQAQTSQQEPMPSDGIQSRDVYTSHYNASADIHDSRVATKQALEKQLDAPKLAATAPNIANNMLGMSSPETVQQVAPQGRQDVKAEQVTDLANIKIDRPTDKIDMLSKHILKSNGLVVTAIMPETPMNVTLPTTEFQGQLFFSTPPALAVGTELSSILQVQSVQSTAPVLPNTALQSVAQTLIQAHASKTGLTLQLDPPEMGRVHIEFQFDTERGVTATIRSDLPETMAALKEKSDFFQQLLRENGFENVDLNFESGTGSQHTPILFDPSSIALEGDVDESVGHIETHYSHAQIGQPIYNRSSMDSVDLRL